MAVNKDVFETLEYMGKNNIPLEHEIKTPEGKVIFPKGSITNEVLSNTRRRDFNLILTPQIRDLMKELEKKKQKETFQKLKTETEEFLSNHSMGKLYDLSEVKEDIQEIIDSLRKRPVTLNSLMELRGENYDYFNHNVAVGTFSYLVGKKIGLSKDDEKLEDLFISGLLHHIGLPEITEKEKYDHDNKSIDDYLNADNQLSGFCKKTILNLNNESPPLNSNIVKKSDTLDEVLSYESIFGSLASLVESDEMKDTLVTSSLFVLSDTTRFAEEYDKLNEEEKEIFNEKEHELKRNMLKNISKLREDHHDIPKTKLYISLFNQLLGGEYYQIKSKGEGIEVTPTENLEYLARLGDNLEDLVHELNNYLSPLTACSGLLFSNEGGNSQLEELLDSLNQVTSKIENKVQYIQYFSCGEESNDEESLASAGLIAKKTEFEMIGLIDEMQNYVDEIQENYKNSVENISLFNNVYNRVSEIKTLFQKDGTYCKPHNLNNLISTALNLYENQLDGVKLEKYFPDQVQVNSDRHLVQRMIINLIKNSQEAFPSNIDYTPRIIIETGVEEGMGYFSIKDNGEGIPEDQKEDVLNKHFTTKEYGTGRGLYFAYKTMKDHDGKLTIDSREGEGTEITGYFPLIEGEE